MDSVDRFGSGGRARDAAIRSAVRADAADGRQDPDFVARADAAVGAAIAHELNVSLGKVGRRQRFEAVVLDPFKQCLQIVRVNILATSNQAPSPPRSASRICVPHRRAEDRGPQTCGPVRLPREREPVPPCTRPFDRRQAASTRQQHRHPGRGEWRRALAALPACEPLHPSGTVSWINGQRPALDKRAQLGAVRHDGPRGSISGDPNGFHRISTRY